VRLTGSTKPVVTELWRTIGAEGKVIRVPCKLRPAGKQSKSDHGARHGANTLLGTYQSWAAARTHAHSGKRNAHTQSSGLSQRVLLARWRVPFGH
jgi:hypothetical protein